MNTTDFLNIGNAICPDRDLIAFEGKSWTFQQVNERVNRLASGFAKMGLAKGDRVGMLQVNCNEYVEAYFATALSNAIFVPLNFSEVFRNVLLPQAVLALLTADYFFKKFKQCALRSFA